MIKHMDSLVRFDFTSDCKTCNYRKELGFMEYCCSFVYDILEKEKLLTMKREILDYVLFDDLSKINPQNIFFSSEDDVWSATIYFKTNLIPNEQVIRSEINDTMNKSRYFKDSVVMGLSEPRKKSGADDIVKILSDYTGGVVDDE